MPNDDPKNGVESRREIAKRFRRAAYERAKAQRASDPKYLALKAAAKARRREIYKQVKEQRRAATRALKEKASVRKAEERKEHDAELMKVLRLTAKGSSAEN